MRAASICTEPRCPQLAVYRGRCAQHRPPVEYDWRWNTIRRRYLERHPRCARCRAPAVLVHHRDGLGSQGAGHIETNLAALCRRCHDADPTTHTPRTTRYRRLSTGAAR